MSDAQLFVLIILLSSIVFNLSNFCHIFHLFFVAFVAFGLPFLLLPGLDPKQNAHEKDHAAQNLAYSRFFGGG